MGLGLGRSCLPWNASNALTNITPILSDISAVEINPEIPNLGQRQMISQTFYVSTTCVILGLHSPRDDHRQHAARYSAYFVYDFNSCKAGRPDGPYFLALELSCNLLHRAIVGQDDCCSKLHGLRVDSAEPWLQLCVPAIQTTVFQDSVAQARRAVYLTSI